MADVPGLVAGRGLRHRGQVTVGRRRDRIGGLEQGPPPCGHTAKEQGIQRLSEPLRSGQEPLERLGPDIHQVDDQIGVEAFCQTRRRLWTLQRWEAGEDHVGPLELAGRDRFVGQPLERAAKVAVAGQAGKGDVFRVGPNGHQPYGKPLFIAGEQRRGPGSLAAVAPRRSPPGYVMAPGRQHAGQRPIPQRGQALAGDVIEWIDDPDGEWQGLGSIHERQG